VTLLSRWTKAAAALLLIAAAARAYPSPGNGIRFGGSEGRLHPFLDLESRYDSNVAYSAADQAIPDLILHVRPGVELKIPSDLAALEFAGAFDWAQYMGVDDSRTKDLSRFFGDARLAAQFVRHSPVSVRIDDDFRRQVSTSSAAAAGRAVVSNSNVLSVSVPWTPGGGALVLTAKGQWMLETFEEYQDEPGGVDVSDLGYSQVRGGAEGQWRFLPRTSAVVSAGYFTRRPNASVADDATGFDALAGVTGLLTARMSATAKVGYASTSTRTRDASTVAADASLEWLPLEALSLRAGYVRSLGVDPFASVYTSDGVVGGFRLRIAERFAFRSDVRYDRLEFSAIPGADTAFLRVDPTLEGMVSRWLTVTAGYVYSSRTASWPVGAPPDYSKNEAFLKLALTY
jgi:hypothetical protein